MKQEFIVAEVTVNWKEGKLTFPQDGLISQRFERVIEKNAGRGYDLHSFTHTQTIVHEDCMSETIVAVFRRAQ